MNIEFTKEQFETLLKMVYLGNWMINSIRPGDEQATSYDKLESFLFSQAHKFELDHLVEEESGNYFPSEELCDDKKLNEFMKDYNEFVFCDELTTQLALRDLSELFGEEAISEMDQDNFVGLILEISKQYADEIEENGIVNLRMENVNIDIDMETSKA